MRRTLKRRSVRVAVWASAGLISAGAIGMLAVPATAAVPTVTYSGGCDLLSATSSPDRDTVSTRKSSASDRTAEVAVTNSLDAPARLKANGKAVRWSTGDPVVIKKGESVTVPFTAGPVELTLVPDCSTAGVDANVTKHFEAATIKVLDARVSESDSKRSPTEERSTTDEDDDSSASESDDNRKADREPVARGAVPADQREKQLGGDGEDSEATDDAAAPPTSGDTDAGGNAEGDSTIYVPTNHTPDSGSTTLALIAAVCLLGVGAAALRTLVIARAVRVSSV